MTCVFDMLTSSISFLSTLQPIITIIAIFVGGYWTYMLFIRRRQKYPRAELSHNINQRIISKDKVLLNIELTIANKGEVLLSLMSGEMRIEQVMPLPIDILDCIDEGRDPVKQGQPGINWPIIESRELSWKDDSFEIEPSESDNLYFDFIIDTNVKSVQIYSYFKNIKKSSREIGWTVTTLLDIKPQV